MPVADRRRRADEPGPAPRLRPVRARRPVDRHRLLRARPELTGRDDRVRRPDRGLSLVVPATGSPGGRRLRAGRRLDRTGPARGRPRVDCALGCHGAELERLRLAHPVADRSGARARATLGTRLDADRGRRRPGRSHHPRRHLLRRALRRSGRRQPALGARSIRRATRRPSATTSTTSFVAPPGSRPASSGRRSSACCCARCSPALRSATSWRISSPASSSIEACVAGCSERSNCG